ncbi:O-antigen ligase family protein [Flavobacteriaceae bacterium]|nr:O-antigen ligase family protein [Flavobacteriaceae bacterium]
MKNFIINLRKLVSAEFIFLFFYSSISLIPAFGSIDKAATQWLLLSLVNTGLVLFVIFNYNNYKFKFFSNSLLIKFYSLFIFSIIISLLYAYNTSEALIKLSQWFTLFSSFILLIIFLSKIPRSHIFSTILLFFIIQLYFTYDGYFKLLEFVNFDFSYSNLIKGVTGNKNITAALFCMTIPVVYYFYLSVKNKVVVFLFFLFLVISFYAVLILGSRSSYVILFFVLIIYFFGFLFYNFKHEKINLIYSLFKMVFPFLFSLFIFSNITSHNTSINVSSRISTLTVKNESVQTRVFYYKAALNQFMESPFLGIGAGNWKIKSIDINKKTINGYTAPYHVHNDFLEVAAELGLLGIIPFFGIFTCIFFYCLKILKSRIIFSDYIYALTLFICFIAYLIDSLFNFPHARPVSAIFLMIIFALITLEYFKLKDHE